MTKNLKDLAKEAFDINQENVKTTKTLYEDSFKKEALAMFLMKFPDVKEESIKVIDFDMDELLCEIEGLRILIEHDDTPHSSDLYKYTLLKEGIADEGEIELPFDNLARLGGAIAYTKEQYEEDLKKDEYGNKLPENAPEPDTFKELVREICEEVYDERHDLEQ